MVLRENSEKKAGAFSEIAGIPMKYLKGLVALSAGAGAGLGAMYSVVTSNKDRKTERLSEERKFYDGQTRELRNRDWLKKVVAADRALSDKSLSEEELAEKRKELGELISKGKTYEQE